MKDFKLHGASINLYLKELTEMPINTEFERVFIVISLMSYSI